MSDPAFSKFYNDVRDASWPMAENYCDFLKLPENIKDECYSVHNFSQRIEEITNSNHWRGLIEIGYQHNDLLYVPVTKCAHLYYVDLFHNQLGWEKVFLEDVNFNNVYAFGLLMHPLTRNIKGQTQWVYQALTQNQTVNITESDIDNYLSDPIIKYLIETTIIGDIHSVPYSIQFGSWLDKIHWIPMDNLTDEQIKNHIISFCGKHNYTLNISSSERINKSTPEKLKIFNFIKQLYSQSYTQNLNQQPNHCLHNIYLNYYFYSQDLKFFHSLIKNFNPLLAQ